MRASQLLPALSLAVAMVVSPSSARAAWPTDPWTGVPLCTAVGDQSTYANQAVPDGAGGAFVAWSDYRGGAANTYLYMTRVTSTGAISPGWPVDGIPVCIGTAYRQISAVLPGTSGDVYVVWDDYRAGNGDQYVQRVTPSGAIAAGWPANGLALTTDTRGQRYGRACVDGAGGIYVVWTFDFSGTDSDIYMSRVLPGGTLAPGFPLNGLSVNASSYVQANPDIAADGLGNAIVSYENSDGTYNHPWVQKIGPTGATTLAYPGRDLAPAAAQNYFATHVIPALSGGAVVSTNVNATPAADGPVFTFLNAALGTRFVSQPPATSGYEAARAIVPDGAGGAFAYITYTTSDGTNGYFYLDHITPSGAALPPLPGAYLFAENSAIQYSLASGANGTGLIAWSRAGNGQDVQMQRMDAGGNLLWPSPYLAQIANTQSVGSIVPDAAGGAIVTYADYRSGVADIYAVKVDPFGYLGDAAPALTRISDVPNDNGGQVSLQWSASYRDASPGFGIARYSVWRRVPGGTLAARIARGARTIDMSEPRPAEAAGVIRVQRDGAQVIGWEYVAAYPARGYASYSAVAPTTSDSLGGGNPRTSFRIQAEAATGFAFWDSAPDSGYSVDNLPPIAPAPFTGTYVAGSATLSWQPNAETDMGTYRLYRGTSPAFVPGPSNLVVEQSGTGYVDAAGSPYYYKLSAVDMHGNESPFTTLQPTGTTGAGTIVPRELALSRPTPNPSQNHADLHFALPREADLLLEVFDASGRRTRTIATGHWSPGEYSMRWDGLDDSGARARAGLYFVRFTAEGRRFQERLVLLQ
ncbi:MAG: FlgD immunoglobulin-like domain containing protein [Candidatus Eisenbacteria bacterium]